MGKIVFHTNISDLESLMRNLPEIFEKEGKTIKNGRNEIKIIEYRGIRLCVKSFNKVTAFNRLMYSWFRDTKAKRSYKTAKKLISLGINTPTPIGYTEKTGRFGLIRNSYYVSLCQEYDFHLTDVLTGKYNDTKNLIKAFADFMGEKVHSAGVWHNDMSNGNILINRFRNTYSFAIIDLNRIKFKYKISPFRGLRNLKRLNGDPVLMALLAEQYALTTHQDPRRFVFRLFGTQLAFESIRKQSKKFLHALDPTRKKAIS